MYTIDFVLEPHVFFNSLSQCFLYHSDDPVMSSSVDFCIFIRCGWGNLNRRSKKSLEAVMMRHHPLAHLRNHEEVNEAVTTKTGYKYSDINHSVSIQYTVSIQQYSVYSTQYSERFCHWFILSLYRYTWVKAGKKCLQVEMFTNMEKNRKFEK